MMSNTYEKHLQSLQSICNGHRPCISIFVPLKWTDLSPNKIFSGLVLAANKLLQKDGQEKLNLAMPDWSKWLNQGVTTLAIYHTGNITTFIPLPLKMQPRVVVASTFHVKPLIASGIGHMHALLLHVNEMGVSLFRVTPADETLIDSYLPSKNETKDDWTTKLSRGELVEFFEFIKLEISAVKDKTTKLLGITGDISLLHSKDFWKDLKLPIVSLGESPKAIIPRNSISILRLNLSKVINDNYNNHVLKVLLEKDKVDDMKLSHLGTKIINKEISKLCVSLDDMHFGELDSKSGLAIVNKSQSNVKDDDLLDDLVELAMKNGIQVSVVPKTYLPNGRSYIAS